MNLPVKAVTPGEIIESVIIKGDLGALKPEERAQYYTKVCESVGLNPLTRPFDYITLSGKLTLYAKRDCADQLRRLNGISIEIVSQTLVGDMFTVHVRANDRAGRIDEDFGVVTLGAHMKGDVRANTILKAITKAKRRVTLSISGLGFLDETEVEDIPTNAKGFPIAKPTPAVQVIGPPAPTLAEEMKDEIPDFGSAAPKPAEEAAPAPHPSRPSTPEAGAAVNFDDDEQLFAMAREAAGMGEDALKSFFRARTQAQKKKLRTIEADLIKLYPAAAQ